MDDKMNIKVLHVFDLGPISEKNSGMNTCNFYILEYNIVWAMLITFIFLISFKLLIISTLGEVPEWVS